MKSVVIGRRIGSQIVHQQNRRLQFPTFNLTPSADSSGGRQRKEYAERRVLGYSRAQMYDIVADVDAYHEFVPWCTTSTVTERVPALMRARLGVGFGVINTAYDCSVVYSRPNFVKSVAVNTPLFDHLISEWKFSPNTTPGHDAARSCILHFEVAFAFKSSTHAQLMHMFFEKIVSSMVSAFLLRARAMHGEASVKEEESKPQVIVHRL